jgi:restriction endonuclease Mrr
MNKSDLPNVAAVADALVRPLKDCARPMRPAELYDDLADLFGLTSFQKSLTRQTRHESAWDNRVQTARKHLVDQGVINGTERGYWSLSEKGRSYKQVMTFAD